MRLTIGPDTHLSLTHLEHATTMEQLPFPQQSTRDPQYPTVHHTWLPTEAMCHSDRLTWPTFVPQAVHSTQAVAADLPDEHHTEAQLQHWHRLRVRGQRWRGELKNKQHKAQGESTGRSR